MIKWFLKGCQKSYRSKCIESIFSIVFAASKTTRLSSPASTPSDVVDLIITAAPTSCKRAMLPMITWIPVVVQQLQPIQTNSAHFPERPLSPRKDSRMVSAFLQRLLSYYCYHSFLAFLLLDTYLLVPDESTITTVYFKRTLSWPESFMTLTWSLNKFSMRKLSFSSYNFEIVEAKSCCKVNMHEKVGQCCRNCFLKPFQKIHQVLGIKVIRITKISKSYKWLQSFWCLADHLWFHLVQPHARLLRSCLTLREMTPPFLWFSAAFCNENSQHPDLQDDRGLSDESQGDTEKIKMMKMAVSLNPSHQKPKPFSPISF